MVADWTPVELGDVVDVKSGKRIPKGFSLIAVPNSHPYVRIVDMKVRKVSLTPDFQFVPDHVFPKISRYITNKDDVLVSIVGTVGSVSITDANLDGASLTENAVKLVNPRGVDRLFLYYWLSSPIGQDEIRKRIVGSTQPKFPLYNIKQLPINLPPLPIQRRIADILGALDDKIECNRRMNATLEAMTQALYKHWLVDVESSELPDDWEIATVGDLCEFAYGKGLKETERTEGQYPVYGSAGVIGTHKDYLVKAPGLVVGRKGTIGKVHRARLPFFPIDTTFYIVPKAPEYSFGFLYLLLGRLDLDKRNNDSAVPGLNRNDVYKLPVVKPPKAVLENFNAKVAPLFQQIDSNDKDNQTLARTRDYLLPKLLSGEVEVKA